MQSCRVIRRVSVHIAVDNVFHHAVTQPAAQLESGQSGTDVNCIAIIILFNIHACTKSVSLGCTHDTVYCDIVMELHNIIYSREILS